MTSVKNSNTARQEGKSITDFPTPRSRYLSHLLAFFPFALVTALLSVLTYWLFFKRDGRADFENLYWVWSVIVAAPLLAATTLAALRRDISPFVGTFLTVIVYFSLGVAVLASFRIPLSYVGLYAVLPVNMLVFFVANVRFHSSVSTRVGMLKFPGDQEVIENLSGIAIQTITDNSIDPQQFDLVLIENSHYHDPYWVDFISRCYLFDIDVVPWTSFMEKHLARIPINRFFDFFSSHSSGQNLYVRSKRVLDIILILLCLPIILVLTAGTALHIWLRDGGPVLFVHHRVGFGRKPFRLYKFRTMYKGTAGGATKEGDDRIIPGCHFIRRLRLDELPQIYNVIRGDMTIIGPRPEAVDLVRWYRKEIPEYDYRLLVRPGITGWAQVNSGYTSNPEEARVKLSFDLYYIKNISLVLDARIALMTVRTILLAAGAR